MFLVSGIFMAVSPVRGHSCPQRASISSRCRLVQIEFPSQLAADTNVRAPFYWGSRCSLDHVPFPYSEFRRLRPAGAHLLGFDNREHVPQVLGDRAADQEVVEMFPLRDFLPGNT